MASSPPRQSSASKQAPNKPCDYFLRTGSCYFGDRCRFAHPYDQLPEFKFNSQGLPLRPGEPDCAYYKAQGRCSFGKACRFNHPEVPRGTVPTKPSTATVSGQKGPGKARVAGLAKAEASSSPSAVLAADTPAPKAARRKPEAEPARTAQVAATPAGPATSRGRQQPHPRQAATPQGSRPRPDVQVGPQRSGDTPTPVTPPQARPGMVMSPGTPPIMPLYIAPYPQFAQMPNMMGYMMAGPVPMPGRQYPMMHFPSPTGPWVPQHPGVPHSGSNESLELPSQTPWGERPMHRTLSGTIVHTAGMVFPPAQYMPHAMHGPPHGPGMSLERHSGPLPGTPSGWSNRSGSGGSGGSAQAQSVGTGGFIPLGQPNQHAARGPRRKKPAGSAGPASPQGGSPPQNSGGLLSAQGATSLTRQWVARSRDPSAPGLDATSSPGAE